MLESNVFIYILKSGIKKLGQKYGNENVFLLNFKSKALKNLKMTCIYKYESGIKKKVKLSKKTILSGKKAW